MTGVHRDYLELAAAGIEFHLTTAERARLEAHVATCDACRRRVAALRSDDQAIATLPRYVLAAATAERLHPARARLRWAPAPGPTLRLVAAVALLALLTMAALTVGAELLRTQVDQDLVVAPPARTAMIAESTDAPAASPLVGAAWRSLGLPQPMQDEQVEALAPNGSSGLIAGGCVQPSFDAGCTDAAVWLSANGADWSDPMLLPGLDGESAGPVRIIVSSADGVVAAGVADRD